MSDEFKAEFFEGEEPYDDEEEEDNGNCGGFGQQLYSYGSEECDFCSRSEECMAETKAWEKRESRS